MFIGKLVSRRESLADRGWGTLRPVQNEPHPEQTIRRYNTLKHPCLRPDPTIEILLCVPIAGLKPGTDRLKMNLYDARNMSVLLDFV